MSNIDIIKDYKNHFPVILVNPGVDPTSNNKFYISLGIKDPGKPGDPEIAKLNDDFSLPSSNGLTDEHYMFLQRLKYSYIKLQSQPAAHDTSVLEKLQADYNDILVEDSRLKTEIKKKNDIISSIMDQEGFSGLYSDIPKNILSIKNKNTELQSKIDECEKERKNTEQKLLTLQNNIKNTDKETNTQILRLNGDIKIIDNILNDETSTVKVEEIKDSKVREIVKTIITQRAERVKQDSKITELSQKLQTLNKEKSDLEHKISDQEKHIKRLINNITNQTVLSMKKDLEYNGKMDQLKKQHELELSKTTTTDHSKLKLQYNNAVAKLKSDHKRGMDELKQKYETTISDFKSDKTELKKQWSEEKSAIIGLYEDTIKKMELDHENLIKKLQLELEAEKTKITDGNVDSNSKLEALVSQHNSKVNDINVAHTKNLSIQKSIYDGNITELIEKHKKLIAENDKNYKIKIDKISAVVSQHETTIQNLKDEHQKTIDELVSNHEKSIQEFKNRYSENKSEIEKLQDEHKSKISEMKEQFQVKIDSLNKKCEDDVGSFAATSQDLLNGVNAKLSSVSSELVDLKKTNATLANQIEEQQKSHAKALQDIRDKQRIATDEELGDLRKKHDEETKKHESKMLELSKKIADDSDNSPLKKLQVEKNTLENQIHKLTEQLTDESKLNDRLAGDIETQKQTIKKLDNNIKTLKAGMSDLEVQKEKYIQLKGRFKILADKNSYDLPKFKAILEKYNGKQPEVSGIFSRVKTFFTGATEDDQKTEDIINSIDDLLQVSVSMVEKSVEEQKSISINIGEICSKLKNCLRILVEKKELDEIVKELSKHNDTKLNSLMGRITRLNTEIKNSTIGIYSKIIDNSLDEKEISEKISEWAKTLEDDVKTDDVKGSILHSKRIMMVYLSIQARSSLATSKIFTEYIREKDIDNLTVDEIQRLSSQLKNSIPNKMEQSSDKYTMMVFSRGKSRGSEIEQLISTFSDHPIIFDSDIQIHTQKLRKNIEKYQTTNIFAYGVSGSGKTSFLFGWVDKQTKAQKQGSIGLALSKLGQTITGAVISELMVIRDENGTDSFSIKTHDAIQQGEHKNVYHEIDRYMSDVRESIVTQNNPKSSRSHVKITLTLSNGHKINVFDLAGDEFEPRCNIYTSEMRELYTRTIKEIKDNKDLDKVIMRNEWNQNNSTFKINRLKSNISCSVVIIRYLISKLHYNAGYSGRSYGWMVSRYNCLMDIYAIQKTGNEIETFVIIKKNRDRTPTHKIFSFNKNMKAITSSQVDRSFTTPSDEFLTKYINGLTGGKITGQKIFYVIPTLPENPRGKPEGKTFATSLPGKDISLYTYNVKNQQEIERSEKEKKDGKLLLPYEGIKTFLGQFMGKMGQPRYKKYFFNNSSGKSFIDDNYTLKIGEYYSFIRNEYSQVMNRCHEAKKTSGFINSSLRIIRQVVEKDMDPGMRAINNSKSNLLMYNPFIHINLKQEKDEETKRQVDPALSSKINAFLSGTSGGHLNVVVVIPPKTHDKFAHFKLGKLKYEIYRSLFIYKLNRPSNLSPDTLKKLDSELSSLSNSITSQAKSRPFLKDAALAIQNISEKKGKTNTDYVDALNIFTVVNMGHSMGILNYFLNIFTYGFDGVNLANQIL